jgi:ribosomal-protein-alanine N-acetyltransferase
MADFPILTTDRLILREFRPEDAAAVFSIFSREIVTRYHNLDVMKTMSEAEDLVTSRAGLWPKGVGVRWAIALAEQPDAVIGSCGVYNLNRAFGSLEIGYDLHPSYWRRGIMTEVLTAAIGYCYSETFVYRLNRIEALTYVEHIASIALLIKLGFQEEGIRREYGYWKNRFHDLRSFALLRRNWESDRRTRASKIAAQTDFYAGIGQELTGGGPAPGPQRSGLRGWIV